MRVKKGVLVILYTLTTAVPLSAMSENQIADEMVNAHNQVRSQVGVGPLSWSDDIARSAQGWANELASHDNCALHHSNNSNLGENLYWASPVRLSDGKREMQNVTPTQVVRSWEKEKVHYNYNANTCKKGEVCGHYTQVVWANTKKVGCAYSVCSNKGQIWVCQYGPPGNYIGQKPY